MIPTPYLFFNGQARDAIAHYGDVLNAEAQDLMTMADGPPEMGVPEDRMDWVMHCTLQVGSGRIMLSDDFTANAPAMEGASVMLEYPTAAEARGVFDRLAEGGEVRMAFEPTFWSTGFGVCSDKFGIRWMIGTEEMPEGASSPAD